jgi:hypothetical protein
MWFLALLELESILARETPLTLFMWSLAPQRCKPGQLVAQQRRLELEASRPALDLPRMYG